jgi:putative peptidoglycan lipid II flippase
MIGLLPFTLFYVLLRGYYALEDTRTPFLITIAFSVVLLITVLPLFSWARDGGRQVAAIALAYSLSYWVGLVITWIVLARRLGSMRSGPTVWGLARIVIAGLISLSVMGLALLFLVNVLGGYHPAHKGELLIIVIVTSVVGLLTYVLAALALRVPEVTQVKNQARGVMHRVVHR